MKGDAYEGLLEKNVEDVKSDLEAALAEFAAVAEALRPGEGEPPRSIP